MNCDFCQKVIENPRHNQKYCRISCRDKALYQKHKEKFKERKMRYYYTHAEEYSKRSKKWREDNKEWTQEYKKTYRKTHKDEINARLRLYRKRNPLKSRTRDILGSKIRKGELPRAKEVKCVICGKQAKGNHHDDYNKPLDVMPLCKEHHIEKDKELRGKSNESNKTKQTERNDKSTL